MNLPEPTPVILLKDAPEIAECDRRIREIHAETEKRLEELRRMAQHASDAGDERADLVWDEVMAAAKARGLLPADFNRDRYGMGIRNGTLLIVQKTGIAEDCRCPACQTFKGMFDGNPFH